MAAKRAAMGPLEWEWEPLGEGAMRWAFPARVKEGHSLEGFQSGTKLVLKIVKPMAYRHGVRIGQEDVKVQRLAGRFADAFNEKKPTRGGKPCLVHFRVGRLLTASEDLVWNRKRVVEKGDLMLLEQRIFGTYEKFNSNSGWSSGVGVLPDAFSHWTWVQSGGEHLVCDLQGYRGVEGGPKWGTDEVYYIFTDPVILSKRAGTYGCTDLGGGGQVQWFRKHQCNSMCDLLGIRDRRPNDGRIPQQAKCLRETSFQGKTPGPAHLNIACDACGMRPIMGERYMSTVKTNYDLCKGCFDAKGESKSQYLCIPRFAVHTTVTCDGCCRRPIRGVRFKHRSKVNYDLCERCFASEGGNFEEYRLITE